MVTNREPVTVPDAAERVAFRLRSALVGAGFNVDRDFDAVSAEVTATGQGYVTLGKLSLAVGEQLCEVLESCEDAALGADGVRDSGESA